MSIPKAVKNRSVRILCFMAASFMLLMSFSVSAPIQVTAKSEQEIQNEIDKLKKEQERIKKEQANLKDKLSQQQKLQDTYKKEIDNVTAQLNQLELQISVINNEIEKTDEQIAEKTDSIAKTEIQIEDKVLEIAQMNEDFKDRLSAMYIADSTNNILGILFGAQTFSEFLSATETVQSVSNKDQKFLKQLDTQHKEMQSLKTSLETQKGDLEADKEKQVERKETLKQSESEISTKVSELKDLYSKNEDTIAEIEYVNGKLKVELHANYENIEASKEELERIRELKRQADEEYKREQEEKKKAEEKNSSSSKDDADSGSKGDSSSSSEGNSGGTSSNNSSSSTSSSSSTPSSSSGSSSNTGNTSGNKYEWPLPGGVVNCHFGGYPGHKGIDLGKVSVGSDIVAAEDGTVLTVQKWDGVSTSNMQSYGNMVFIYHPKTGQYTRYAHCNSTNVSVGQKVTRGQKIATMGKSGNVTGPHLHFELLNTEKNTSRIDPYPYIK